MVFHLRLVVSLKTRKGKQGSKGLSKELIPGKSIWLEAYKNKIASIISKYACELGSINKNQAKAIVQAINELSNWAYDDDDGWLKFSQRWTHHFQIELSKLSWHVEEKQGFQIAKCQEAFFLNNYPFLEHIL